MSEGKYRNDYSPLSPNRIIDGKEWEPYLKVILERLTLVIHLVMQLSIVAKGIRIRSNKPNECVVPFGSLWQDRSAHGENIDGQYTHLIWILQLFVDSCHLVHNLCVLR